MRRISHVIWRTVRRIHHFSFVTLDYDRSSKRQSFLYEGNFIKIVPYFLQLVAYVGQTESTTGGSDPPKRISFTGG